MWPNCQFRSVALRALQVDQIQSIRQQTRLARLRPGPRVIATPRPLTAKTPFPAANSGPSGKHRPEEAAQQG